MGFLLGAAAIGAAGSIGGALLSKPKKGGLSRSDKQRLAGQHVAQQRAITTADLYNQIAEERLVRSEQTRLGLFADFGRPGTYEQSYEDYLRSPGAGYSAGPTKNLFKKITKSARVPDDSYPYADTVSDENKTASASGYVLKPGPARAFIKDTRTFRMLSYQNAEADQLQRREGPLYQDFMNSVTGPIFEGAAALQRGMSEIIADGLGKGGTARRAALATTQQMRAVEEVNRTRTTQMWNAKLAVDQYARDNVRTVAGFQEAWLGGLPGIRDPFNALMTQVGQYYGNVIMPAAVGAAQFAGNMLMRQNAFQAQYDTVQDGLGEIVSGLGMIVSGSALNAYFEQGTQAPGGGGLGQGSNLLGVGPAGSGGVRTTSSYTPSMSRAEATRYGGGQEI